MSASEWKARDENEISLQRRTTCVNSFTRGSGSDFVLVVVVRFSFVGSLLTIATAVPLFDTAPCQLLTIVNQHHQLIDDGRAKKKRTVQMEDARRFSRKMKHFAFFLLYDSISHTQQQRLASSYYWTSLIAPSRSVFDNERKEMQVNRMRECNLFKNFFSSVCFWKCLRKASSHQGKKLCLVRWCLIFLETRGCGRANERTHSRDCFARK